MQESQLVPYRRNMQDLLCDSGMIPYPEVYQNIYQQRRLGTLGHEWRPPSIKFAVGPTFNPNTGDYQMLPIVDLDRWVEPLPQIVDAIDWEPEIEVQSDDTDSEYNAPDESSSENEHVSLTSGSNGNPEGSGEDILVDHDKLDSLRRSKRKKHKSKAEFTTSSGRRVKRRNLDERDGITSSRGHKSRRPRNGGVASRKKSTSKSSRPRRLAAQNARNLLSRINGVSTDEEDEDDSESCSSESELSAQSDEFEGSKKNNVVKHVREIEASRDECEGALPPQQTETETNTGTRRRLILKLPIRDRKPIITAKTARPESHEQDSIIEAQVEVGPSQSSMDIKIRETTDNEKNQDQPNAVYKGNNMMWGEVKTRSTKRLRLGDASLMDGPIIAGSDVNSHPKSKEEFGASLNSGIIADGDNFDKKGYKIKEGALDSLNVTRIKDDSPEHMCIDHSNIDETLNGFHVDNDIENPLPSTSIKNNGNQSRSIYPKLRIKSNVLVKGTIGSSSKLKSVAVENSKTFESKAEQNLDSSIREEDEGTSSQSPDHSDWNVNSSISHDSKKHLDFFGKKYNAVYRRSKLSRGWKNHEGDINGVEQSTSDVYNNNGNTNMDYSYVMADGGRITRSMGVRASTDELNSTVSNLRVIEGSGSLAASRSGGNSNFTGDDKLLFEDWKPTTRMAVGLRSSRNRRESYSTSARSVDQRKHDQPARKLSWLMLSEQEGYRYIPQQGDEVAYLRQGHEECAELSQETGTRRLFNGSLKAVEFCRIRGVEYSSYRGSGESCCKLTLEIIDSSSIGFGKVFKLTLPELLSSPDFLVERTRYNASIERNWTHRDRCKVWWWNKNGDGGSWYDGRILQVKPKSPEYPESPWERYVIKYKDPPSETHSHSPWELRDPDSRWEHPCIDQRSRDKLLSCLHKIERTSARKKDDYGIDKLNQVAHKSEFLNRFPVPLSFEVIKSRLENNYYRNLEAIEHDANIVVSNAESYFCRNTDMVKKMRRLSEWIDEIFESL